MDSLQDTPTKRRKLDSGLYSKSASGKICDSADDSGDELPYEYYDTLETELAVPNGVYRKPEAANCASSDTFITQPTQILVPKSPMRLASPVIQVAASSPLRPSPPIRPKPKMQFGIGGNTSSAMAPPGTAYRPPVGIITDSPKKPFSAVTVSSDDDGPTYQGSSSEDDLDSRSRIKPSSFIMSAQKALNNSNAHAKPAEVVKAKSFTDIASSFKYDPKSKSTTSSLAGSVFDQRNRDEGNTSSRIPTTANRSFATLTASYGGTQRGTRPLKQNGPSKAAPIVDLTLDDIPDYSQRKKIEEMRSIVPQLSVLQCRTALNSHKQNVDDALELLTSEQESKASAAVDLTMSDDELTPVSATQVNSAKQQIRAPHRKIQDKYTTLSNLQKPKITPQATSSSPINSPKPMEDPTKPRRRLVKGRRKASPVPSSPPKPTAVPTPISTKAPLQQRQKYFSITSDDDDSAIGSEPKSDTGLDANLLKFFNECTVPDLADIAEENDDIATLIISKRPFKNLDAVRGVADDQKPASVRAKKVRKPVGEKIVEKCRDMLAGYDAIDQLVKRVEELGKPVADSMAHWGVNVFGNTSGELEIVNVDATKDGRNVPLLSDSGIGTPISNAASLDGKEDEDDIRTAKPRKWFFPQPSIMAEGVVLKDYQVVGINWLSLLHKQDLSCMLADDMGLGKTCQVIAFLAHLLEEGNKGPHLVVVPGSTLENWLREFKIFCPTLNVVPYYGKLNERAEARENIEYNRESINVIVTTYSMAKQRDDNKFLRKLKPQVCVYDEGHQLKNPKSAGYEQMMRIPARFRLILTGTPLQNNLKELASLLGFILPSVFKEHEENLEFVFNHKAKTTDDTHAALLSKQRIDKARSMMTPFILRRKKHQVLQHLPAKIRRTQLCKLTDSQKDLYGKKQEEVKRILAAREAGDKTATDSTNCLMDLRKVAIHPCLLRRRYTDKDLSRMAKACVKHPTYLDSNVDLIYEDFQPYNDYELHDFCDRHREVMAPFLMKDDVWMDSGKVQALCELLRTYKQNGDRCLIFSQFTMVLSVLEYVLQIEDIKFFRLDGSTPVDDRQDMIDQFYADEQITVFLLSTKAGGAGINLACANKVVIFDSGFNPQDDIQAENRAHRVGQTREVEVVRFVSEGTVEEGIAKLGESKLALDEKVAGGGDDVKVDRKLEVEGIQKLEEMLLQG
ncbi:hypothetical protein MMC25_004817 [Agyrium rufum]|nr:hypothetical protein [Agyrium rufum]